MELSNESFLSNRSLNWFWGDLELRHQDEKTERQDLVLKYCRETNQYTVRYIGDLFFQDYLHIGDHGIVSG